MLSTSAGTFAVRPISLARKTYASIRQMLFTKLKFSPNTVILRLASLRFFYIHVLKRGWSIAETPYPKKVRHLPGVLSQEEVGRLIDAADSPFHRILLMTLYATGARRAEAARLKVSDIDSQRMVVHIHEGKGGRDRDVMLSPKLLEELRAYWRGLRRKPKEWLFPGNRWHTASYACCSDTIGSSTPSGLSVARNMRCAISAPTLIASPFPTPGWSLSPSTRSLSAGGIPRTATRRDS